MEILLLLFQLVVLVRSGLVSCLSCLYYTARSHLNDYYTAYKPQRAPMNHRISKKKRKESNIKKERKKIRHGHTHWELNAQCVWMRIERRQVPLPASARCVCVCVRTAIAVAIIKSSPLPPLQPPHQPSPRRTFQRPAPTPLLVSQLLTLRDRTGSQLSVCILLLFLFFLAVIFFFMPTNNNTGS